MGGVVGVGGLVGVGGEVGVGGMVDGGSVHGGAGGEGVGVAAQWVSRRLIYTFGGPSSKSNRSCETV